VGCGAVQGVSWLVAEDVLSSDWDAAHVFDSGGDARGILNAAAWL
jgi:hypothetical protein